MTKKLVTDLDIVRSIVKIITSDSYLVKGDKMQYEVKDFVKLLIERFGEWDLNINYALPKKGDPHSDLILKNMFERESEDLGGEYSSFDEYKDEVCHSFTFGSLSVDIETEEARVHLMFIHFEGCISYNYSAEYTSK